ncbi:MAG: response regulator [Lachnospiraceae bacterium]|nr:response regulator [Lachnospiraceae bacterium]
MDKSIVFTNENCIGCNKCIKACSAIGACISKEENGKARIDVDGSKCVACGSCIDVCAHGAREYLDDTERFFADLENGEAISLLLAPSFKANYPDEYESVLGGLKKLGVNRIISVSFGADITTWGYLNYIEKYNFIGGISQPCPAVVSYIERYLPELLPKLFPVQSPLMCAAIYARKEMGITDKFAFISPCIAKKIEIEDPHNAGLVHYNVTFEHLMKYVKEHNVKGPSTHSEIEYGLGSFYPTPGGLAENVKWFLGDQVYIRQIEGERHLYEWMHQNESRIKEQKTPFLFIDALNCEKGCICGTAINPERSKTDDSLYALLDIRERSKKAQSGHAWSRPDTPEERLKNYNLLYKDLKLEDYLREYTDRSSECSYEIPDEDELDRIFTSMNKLTQESRRIDCTCCGYDSCAQMATAIYNGFNHKENCIYYEKTMVHELEIEKTIAEETTRAKSAFLANMSHEIRTPINAVLGMNEMILRESGEENVLEYAENVRAAGNTLLGLINNILDFSKIEAGKMEIIPVEYDLSSMINDLVNIVQTNLEKKGLKLKLSINENTPRLLYGDEVRVKQVITNILTNAVKYTEKGSVTFCIDYERPADDPDNVLLHISVKDTGIGIRQEDMAKLFTEFERFEENRNRTIEGTGLGMNITQQLLEMMGSTLEVESVYGEGSNFHFNLKQKVIKWEPLGNYETSYHAAVSKHNKYREKFTAPDAVVLVVDDTETNLDVFKSLLKRTKMRIDTAISGYECLKFTHDTKYDVIFLDHMMPLKDGIETFHEMRAQEGGANLDTPAVCLTANAISGAREKYLAEGFNDYLTKPINADRLEELLMQYLPAQKVIVSKDENGENAADNEETPEKPLPGWLTGCEGIDAEAGVANCGGNEEYLTVLNGFYSAIGAKADEISEYFVSGDIKNYTIKVHALKSSARIVGASELSEMAKRLEDAGNDNNVDYINDNTEELLKKYRSYLDILSPLGENNDDLPDIPAEMLEDAYGGLMEFTGAKDYELVRMVMDSVKEYKLPPADKERFAKLQERLLQMDWDGMTKILQER